MLHHLSYPAIISVRCIQQKQLLKFYFTLGWLLGLRMLIQKPVDLILP